MRITGCSPYAMGGVWSVFPIRRNLSRAGCRPERCRAVRWHLPLFLLPFHLSVRYPRLLPAPHPSLLVLQSRLLLFPPGNLLPDQAALRLNRLPRSPPVMFLQIPLPAQPPLLDQISPVIPSFPVDPAPLWRFLRDPGN